MDYERSESSWHGGDRSRERFSSRPGAERSGNLDEPQYSRLFIICSRESKEADIRVALAPFGTITDVFMPKDRVTQETKGIVYVKFEKASQAANAVEELNGHSIQGSSKPIKVMIAQSRKAGTNEDFNETERMSRLFIIVPKGMAETEIEESFSQFGDLEYVRIVKDRNTNKSKGCGFVKFFKASQGALAMEECDKRMFKPIYAEPKGAAGGAGAMQQSPRELRRPFPEPAGGGYDRPHLMPQQQHVPVGPPSGGSYKLCLVYCSSMGHDQISRLCDLLPGFEYCTRAEGYGSSRSVVYAVYDSYLSTLNARDKLNAFEYPPGFKLSAKLADESNIGHGVKRMNDQDFHSYEPPLDVVMDYPNGSQPPSLDVQTTLKSLTDQVSQLSNALSVAQQAGGGGGGAWGDNVAFGSSDAMRLYGVQLGERQPLVPSPGDNENRLFVVFQPRAPPNDIIQDVFCRIGNLVGVTLMRGKNCGYAQYATAESAGEAVATLHGRTICNSLFKVIVADPPPGPDGRKRMKTGDF